METNLWTLHFEVQKKCVSRRLWHCKKTTKESKSGKSPPKNWLIWWYLLDTPRMHKILEFSTLKCLFANLQGGIRLFSGFKKPTSRFPKQKTLPQGSYRSISFSPLRGWIVLFPFYQIVGRSFSSLQGSGYQGLAGYPSTTHPPRWDGEEIKCMGCKISKPYVTWALRRNLFDRWDSDVKNLRIQTY